MQRAPFLPQRVHDRRIGEGRDVAEVMFAWIVNPLARKLEVLARVESGWQLRSVWRDDARVAIEFDSSVLWADVILPE